MSALLDFLKNKKDAPAAAKAKAGREKAKPAGKTGKVSAEKKPEKVKKQEETKPVAQTASKARKSSGFSYEAIKEPHISEKATYLAEKDQYTFVVSPNYNKNEIKKSVEGIYGVDVLSVNMIKIPPKKRRLGKTEGFKKAYIKAIVKIKNGQKIEIL